jgi:hypothetical protein
MSERHTPICREVFRLSRLTRHTPDLLIPPMHFVWPRSAASWRCLGVCFLLGLFVVGATETRADSCPSQQDEIATDRPDVANSSLVVPVGSFQSENGVNLSARDGGRSLDGTNTRWRVGVAPCLEVLVDLPGYLSNLRSPGTSDFTDVAPAVKWQSVHYPAGSTCPWWTASRCQRALLISHDGGHDPICSCPGRASSMTAGV